MNKKQIEDAVKAILDKEESPLATALRYEIANYEHSLLELKLMHRENLEQLLDVYRKRGIDNGEISQEIRNRLEIL